MKIVIDTHILLWWVTDDKRLSHKARRLIESTQNKIIVSAASFWEIAIKQTLGRIKIDVAELEEAITIDDFEPLPIKLLHTVEVAGLPLHHNDPFDRMLIAQCLCETAHLLTHDEALSSYGKVVMVV